MSAPVDVEPDASVTYICCGRRLRHVDLSSPGSSLSFTHCSGCDTTRWYRGHRQVDPDGALDLRGVTASLSSADARASAVPRT